MPTMTYPHTTIIADLQRLAQTSGETAATAKRVLDMYLSKKAFYTARIAELEASATVKAQADTFATAFSPVEAEPDTPAASKMEYPHTRIQENLAKLEQSLRDLSCSHRTARLALVANIKSGYAKKRAWFSTVRAGGKAEYPHTDIQDQISELRTELSRGNNPKRLALLGEVEREYMLKRAWFETLPH